MQSFRSPTQYSNRNLDQPIKRRPHPTSTSSRVAHRIHPCRLRLSEEFLPRHASVRNHNPQLLSMRTCRTVMTRSRCLSQTWADPARRHILHERNGLRGSLARGLHQVHHAKPVRTAMRSLKRSRRTERGGAVRLMTSFAVRATGSGTRTPSRTTSWREASRAVSSSAWG